MKKREANAEDTVNTILPDIELCFRNGGSEKFSPYRTTSTKHCFTLNIRTTVS